MSSFSVTVASVAVSTVTKTVTLVSEVPAPDVLRFDDATSEGCPTGTVTPGTTVTLRGNRLQEVEEHSGFLLTYPTEAGSSSGVPLDDVTVAADGRSLTCQLGEMTNAKSGEGSVKLCNTEGEVIASCAVNVLIGA